MTDIATRVRTVLDPPARKNKAGMWISADAYYNLEGAIQDLRHTKADAVCIRTLERVQKQIARVLKICEKKPTR